jgi:electron transport complex protein RnfD
MLISAKAPHISSDDNYKTIFTDLLVALVPLIVMAYYYYGVRALMLIAVSMLTCAVSDFVMSLITKRKIRQGDISALITGTIIALMMPAAVPYHVVVTAAIFAIVIAKHPFGGLGHNPFNPACAGFVFAALSFPNRVFSYTVPFENLPLFGEYTGLFIDDITSVMKLGGVPNVHIDDLLFGNVAGAIGTTSILVIFACLIFLIVRRIVSWEIFIGVVVSVSVIAYLFPRIPVAARGQSVVLEMFCGSLFFGAVFVATDPITAPRLSSARYIYGAFIGALTLFFRNVGAYPLGLPFAVIIANSLSYSIDRGLCLLTYKNATDNGFILRWFLKCVRKAIDLIVNLIMFVILTIKMAIKYIFAVLIFIIKETFKLAVLIYKLIVSGSKKMGSNLTSIKEDTSDDDEDTEIF